MSSEAAPVRAPLRLSSGCAFLPAAAASAPATRLAPPPSPRAQEFVYIKRTGGSLDADEVFAPLSIDGVASVGLLAKRACAEFGWGVPTQMRLYLVPHAGKENPTADEETSAEALDKPAYSLADAGIASGSWLLARVSGPATADGASCVDVGVVTYAWTKPSKRPRWVGTLHEFVCARWGGNTCLD